MKIGVCNYRIIVKTFRVPKGKQWKTCKVIIRLLSEIFYPSIMAEIKLAFIIEKLSTKIKV